ncbi:tRNA (adenosine(37)-N6)-threonylcarbamoyltransferase complex ATPase subunit type 1 TsaE [Desulfocurvus sp. DL9XJH121]
MSDATLRLHLPDEEATLALGRALARALLATHPAQTVLLCGDLGAGKTTLVRALVESLPGGDEAQVSSPSFNIMNLYPTEPRAAHFDLYRLEGMGTDEALVEEMQDPGALVLVEWAQFLDPRDLPGEYLSLAWENAPAGRTIVLTATGKKATQTLSALS